MSTEKLGIYFGACNITSLIISIKSIDKDINSLGKGKGGDDSQSTKSLLVNRY